MFRCRLMRPSLEELEAGTQAVVRVDVNGEGLEDRIVDVDPSDPHSVAEEQLAQRRGWRQDERDKGCDVLRVMDTEKSRYVWFKLWTVDMTFKVKFEKSSDKKDGQLEKAKEVESADPYERALESVRRDVETGKVNLDEVASEVMKGNTLRVSRLFEMSEKCEDTGTPAPDVVELKPRRSSLAPFGAFESLSTKSEEEKK